MQSDYAAAGFGRALKPGNRPALILIDFARAYFDPASPLYAGVERVRDVAVALREAAATAGVPVIFTRVEYVANDPAHDGGLFYRKIAALTAFDRGNPLGDFTPELAPRGADLIVTKQFPSAFFGNGAGRESSCRWHQHAGHYWAHNIRLHSRHCGRFTLPRLRAARRRRCGRGPRRTRSRCEHF